MIQEHTCVNGHKGKLYIPLNAEKTIVTCPICKVKEDVRYLVYYDNNNVTLEELERREYMRLKEIYG